MDHSNKETSADTITLHINFVSTQNIKEITSVIRAAHRGGGGGGATGAFCPGPQPERGPLNTCLKDRYTLIEQSDLNTLIEQSQYSSEEQCSKLIDKEIW